MINLDGFEENTIITESASFYDIVLMMNYKFIETEGKKVYKISLTGMEGGHSGFDIDKEKGNSILELANLVNQIEDIEIANFIGGTKFNVIPSQAECIFKSNLDINDIIKEIETSKEHLLAKYNDINILVEEIDHKYRVISYEESKEFLEAIISFRHGVFNKNSDGQVTTSANLGVVDLGKNTIKIGVRSSKKDEEEDILEYIKIYSNRNEFEFKILGSQPGFETRKDSELIEKLIETYEKTVGDNKLVLKSVHITVEVGFFKNKIPELDFAIISPKIIGAHTINEMVEIKSINNCNKWLEEFILSY